MILVTGSTGLIGSEVLRLLSHAGVPARALVRKSSRGQDAARYHVGVWRSREAEYHALLDTMFRCVFGDAPEDWEPVFTAVSMAIRSPASMYDGMRVRAAARGTGVVGCTCPQPAPDRGTVVGRARETAGLQTSPAALTRGRRTSRTETHTLRKVRCTTLGRQRCLLLLVRGISDQELWPMPMCVLWAHGGRGTPMETQAGRPARAAPSYQEMTGPAANR